MLFTPSITPTSFPFVHLSYGFLVLCVDIFLLFQVFCRGGNSPPWTANQCFFQTVSGYITTDAQHGRALFYYFVEAKSASPLSRPLTLWLNGGYYLSYLIIFLAIWSLILYINKSTHTINFATFFHNC